MIEGLDMLSHVLAPASHFMAQDLVLDLAPLTKCVRNRGTVFFLEGEWGNDVGESEDYNSVIRHAGNGCSRYL
jgi:hypothetical protein